MTNALTKSKNLYTKMLPLYPKMSIRGEKMENPYVIMLAGGKKMQYWPFKSNNLGTKMPAEGEKTTNDSTMLVNRGLFSIILTRIIHGFFYP